MELLPEDKLIQTSRVDHADWSYRPLLSFVMRRRYALAISLLPDQNVHRMLEVGYGSGIFMPELAKRCEQLYGIDVHPEADPVQARLLQCGVQAALSRQDAADTNFPDQFFDAIVSLSALEFIERIDDAATEFLRLLKPGGRVIAVMPAKSAVLDFALHAVTGESADRDYGNRRERVLPALLKHFRIKRKKSFFPIYNAYELAAETSSTFSCAAGTPSDR
jgi:ubiquinone/menaquinone biosynthesis C-methylase UbiE